jgi:hypothetical protein
MGTVMNDSPRCRPHLPRLVAVICALAMLSSLHAHAQAAGPLTLTFQPHGAVIDGVTPGGTLVVFASARTQIQLHYAESVGMKFMMRDKSGSGRIVVDMGRELPVDAVWAVVDLATGRHLVVPRGLARQRPPLSADAVRYKTTGQPKLRIELPVAEVLVVRAGENAWFEVMGDGGRADEDGHPNGGSDASPMKLQSLRKKYTKALDKIRKGDVIVVIDPVSLRTWSSAELGE